MLVNEYQFLRFFVPIFSIIVADLTAVPEDFETQVVPVGQLSGGIALDSVEGGAYDIYSHSTRHYNRSTGTYQATRYYDDPPGYNNVPADEPIWVFGSKYEYQDDAPIGGEPLYTNQSYSVVAHIGRPVLENAFRVEVYGLDDNNEFVRILYRDITVPTPWTDDGDAYGAMIESGSDSVTEYIPGIGLEITIKPVPGTYMGAPSYEAFVITFRASLPDYYYSVLGKGLAFDGQNLIEMAKLSSGAHAYERLFDMSFVNKADTFSSTLLKPVFDSEPMPPMYLGMSPDEIMNHLPDYTFDGTFNVETASGPKLNSQTTLFKQLDHSPELRRHPILDDFVDSLGNDPLTLANYVQNEIELIDAFYQVSESGGQARLGPRGISRSALAVFQEEQGSPIEQCALLVYLLRQAGVPAFYMKPQANQLKLLSSQISAMLGVQIQEYNNTSNKLVAVNFPFVAAYIDGQYKYIFPWIKDTEVIEGFDLYSLMPVEWNSPYKWFHGYIHNDPVIMSLDERDQPDVLWPKFIEKQLQTYYPFLSLDDLGVQIKNRKQYYPSFDDLPRPYSVTGNPTAFESYGLPVYRNIFNKKRLEIYVGHDIDGDGNTPDLLFDSGENNWLECDLHNRRFFIYADNIQRVGGGSDIEWLPCYVVLQPYRPAAADDQTDISMVDPFASNSGVVNGFKEEVRITVDDPSSNFAFFNYAYLRESYLIKSETPAGATGQGNAWPILNNRESYTMYVDFFTGDSVAFCSNTGRVTERMLEVHVQDIWSNQQSGNRDKKIDHGAFLYLQGQSYWYRVGRFAETVNDLHKVRMMSSLFGLAGVILEASSFTNRIVSYGYPAFDVTDAGNASVLLNLGYGEIHPDEFSDFSEITSFLIATLGSTLEHGIIMQFWNGLEAASAIKVLQKSNPVLLTHDNYIDEGNKFYKDGAEVSSGTTGSQSLKSIFGDFTWDVDLDLIFNTNKDSVFSYAWASPGEVSVGDRQFYSLVAINEGVDQEWDIIGSGGQVLNGAFGVEELGDPIDYGLVLEMENIGLENLNAYIAIPYDDLLDVTVDTYPPDAAPDIINNLKSDIENWIDKQPQASLELAKEQGKEFSPGVTSAGSQISLNVNNGQLIEPNFYDAPNQKLGDPVDITTGALVIDEVDVSLPGPFPLELRRNYNSQDASFGSFGWAWKISFLPYLVFNDAKDRIRAAELDGSVVEYRLVATNGPGYLEFWVPFAEDNPTMTNNNMDGIGSLANPFNNIILKKQFQVNGTPRDFYELFASDGSVRQYMVQSFHQNGYDRTRPYLVNWWDNRQNRLEFQYGDDDSKSSWGQLTRVEGSSGVFLNFRYDTYGRIVEADTSDGRWFRYEYDEHNTLRRVIRPDNSSIRYDYQIKKAKVGDVEKDYSTYAITRIESPDGRLLINEYDANQRVVRQSATVGQDLFPVQNASYKYTERTIEGKTFQENTITDVFGNKTVYEIFDGMITRIKNPLNQNEYRSYFINTNQYFDARDKVIKSNGANGYQRSLHSTEDKRILPNSNPKRGLKTFYQYDNRGNLISVEREGHFAGTEKTESVETTYEYDARDRLIKISGPRIQTDSGAYRDVTEYIYDLSDKTRAKESEFPNISRTQDSKNHTFLPKLIIKRNDNQLLSGTFISYRNLTKKVSGKTYFANGVLNQERVAYKSSDEALTTYSYDNNLPLGFPNKRTSYSGTSDPSYPNIEIELLHNQRGEVVKEIAPDGTVTRYDYDVMSRLTATRIFDDSDTGEPISWNFTYYNGNGEPTWSDGPAHGPEDYVFRDYDGAGRVIAELVWRSQANSDGTGVEAVPDQDSFQGQAMTTYQYDGFGNLTSMIDPNGNVTAFLYDKLGRPTNKRITDNSGELLNNESYTYEPGGKIKTITNGKGGVTDFKYTSYGDVYYRKNPDGTIHKWRYYKDGRLKEEIHANNTVTEYAYDDNNFTVKASITGTGYSPSPNESYPTVTTVTDRRGNVVSSTDMDGFTFTTEYDDINRVKRTVGPDPVTSSQLIDTYSYDPVNRKVTVNNQANEKIINETDRLGRPFRTYIHNASGEIERSGTDYSDDFHSATSWRGNPKTVKTTTWFNTLGQPVIVRHDDGTYTMATYDRNGNVVESQDEIGQISTFTYDGLNRIKSSTTPDGATTFLGYDLIGNLTSRIMPGDLIWTSEYDVAGRMKSEVLGQGDQITRNFSYSHYSGQAQAPDVFERAQLKLIKDESRGISYKYPEYDGFGRIVEMNTSGSAAVYHLKHTFEYDLRGNITKFDQDYTNSSLEDTEIIRTYDDYSRLETEQIKRGISIHTDLMQSWDNAGRREKLHLATTSAGTPELAFDYTAAGRVDLITSRVGGTARTFDYQYNNAGFLNKRINLFREREITNRDVRGRPLAVSTKVTGTSTPFLVENNILWRNDSKLNQYMVSRQGAPITSNENKIFQYNSRGQLTQEKLKRPATVTVTADYGYDEQKLGVMTSMSITNAISGNIGFESGFSDFMRLGNVRLNGQKIAVSGTLTNVGEALEVRTRKVGSSSWQDLDQWAWTDSQKTQWAGEFNPEEDGNYQLQVSAVHESSVFIGEDGRELHRVQNPTSETETVSFSVTENALGEPVNLIYDEAGFITSKTWSDGQTQTFKWDALGRLIELNQTGTGAFAFDAVYDGAGRRLACEYTPSGGSTVMEECLFDPMVEFLELAVKVQVTTDNQEEWVWKIHGPDMGAGYGSLQGIGGIEAFIGESSDKALGAVTDFLGNVVATISESPKSVSWSDTVISAYGPLPGSTMHHIDGSSSTVYTPSGETTTPVQALAAATTWRSMRIDPTVYICMGTRYYDPLAGRFMSPDPLGHAASMDLYSYANGDPINFVDPTGRAPGKAPTDGVIGSTFQKAGIYLYMTYSIIAQGNPVSRLYKRWDNGRKVRGEQIGQAIWNFSDYYRENAWSNFQDNASTFFGGEWESFKANPFLYVSATAEPRGGWAGPIVRALRPLRLTDEWISFGGRSTTRTDNIFDDLVLRADDMSGNRGSFWDNFSSKPKRSADDILDKHEARKLSRNLPDNLKCDGVCDKYADALQDSLKKRGISGERIRVEAGVDSSIYSDRLGKQLSGITNEAGVGYHDAIRVGDEVFDNFRPQGIPVDEFFEDLGGSMIEQTGGRVLTTTF
ncbi:DUF6531 domain-containing protein [Rubellicoccus peritrichatus]|uniref:RHS repeat-associated core domain-containing protein n=1 Tax=Rubellicoccus peritrichatus TaxID=3080537 RepID=A0AAQ3QTV1_9BACT|nr:DUF6531 domain-containing protein [Puniceicoccus sp. CR14]WOO39345.1 RHS repeat-associated core domain-containing protein [Puniceicoccus sp. CR14]